MIIRLYREWKNNKKLEVENMKDKARVDGEIQEQVDKRKVFNRKTELLSKVCPINNDKCNEECIHFYEGRIFKPCVVKFLCAHDEYFSYRKDPIMPCCKLWGNYLKSS